MYNVCCKFIYDYRNIETSVIVLRNYFVNKM